MDYVVKGEGCCGEEDEAEDEAGCCKNENHVLKSSVDFTFKSFAQHQINKPVTDLFYSALFNRLTLEQSMPTSYLSDRLPLPPKLQSGPLIETTVIRI